MTAAAEALAPHPKTPASPKPPGFWLLVIGAIYPACVIAFEAATRFCATTFFDPMPTPPHILLVALAPLSVVWLWAHLRFRSDQAHEPQLSVAQAVAAGAALMISALYTLLFLPLYPLSALAILAYGLGLLPFAPLATLVCGALLLARAGKPNKQARRGIWVWFGAGLGVLALAALDTPQAATTYAVHMSSKSEAGEARALALLRSVGSRDHLLRLCYESTGMPAGPVSALVALGEPLSARLGFDEMARDQRLSRTVAAQQLYYRLTGDPYTAKEPPFREGAWGFTQGLDWDADQGGSVVGAKVRGLALSSSRIDGVIVAEDAVAYLEWTMEFTAENSAEARASLVLPPGGVVSRATLWVAGQEREAVFASRDQARQAYENVVVRERRDPLLVTTKGADRVMFQVFPVMPEAASQIRIGITAPLDLTLPGQASVALPAIIDRNFTIGSELRHAVWVEGKGEAAGVAHGLEASTPKAGAFRLRGALDDVRLARERPRLVVTRAQDPHTTLAPGRAVMAQPDTAAAAKPSFIVQTIASAPAQTADAIVFVLDGSLRAGAGAAGVKAALAALPSDRSVGLIIAGEPPGAIAPAVLDQAHRAALDQALAQHKPRGGQDNVTALTKAVLALEPFERGVLVWLHGPQPTTFSRANAGFDQALARATRLPRLVLYPLAPGPNVVLSDTPWFWGAQTMAWSGDAGVDLTHWLKAETAPSRLMISRTETAQKPAHSAGSDHIARLWARDQIARLAATGKAADRASGVDLARAYGLVAPISGAVVLETDVDIQRAGLTAPDATSVPTVPEPEQWMLLVIVSALIVWTMWRQRRMAARS